VRSSARLGSKFGPTAQRLHELNIEHTHVARPVIVDDWQLPWQGGCLCGGIRFRIDAAPLLTIACHCNWCQKRSASAFSLILCVPQTGFTITQGEPEPGWAHGDHPHSFCPRCKNWLFLRLLGQDVVNIRATMLDDYGWFAPYVEIFTASKLPWVSSTAKHSFAGQPSPRDYASLIQSFAHDGPASRVRYGPKP
jgi:hypothetical protein